MFADLPSAPTFRPTFRPTFWRLPSSAYLLAPTFWPTFQRLPSGLPAWLYLPGAYLLEAYLPALPSSLPSSSACLHGAYLPPYLLLAPTFRSCHSGERRGRLQSLPLIGNCSTREECGSAPWHVQVTSNVAVNGRVQLIPYGNETSSIPLPPRFDFAHNANISFAQAGFEAADPSDGGCWGIKEDSPALGLAPGFVTAPGNMNIRSTTTRIRCSYLCGMRVPRVVTHTPRTDRPTGFSRNLCKALRGAMNAVAVCWSCVARAGNECEELCFKFPIFYSNTSRTTYPSYNNYLRQYAAHSPIHLPTLAARRSSFAAAADTRSRSASFASRRC